MNKRGQTLILFVILLPLILGIAALVVDVGIQIHNSRKLEEVTKMAIKDALNKENINIQDVLVKNEISIDGLEVTKTNEKIRVKNEYEIDSIFGVILGIKKYQIKVDITGYKLNDKIVFE